MMNLKVTRSTVVKLWEIGEMRLMFLEQDTGSSQEASILSHSVRVTRIGLGVWREKAFWFPPWLPCSTGGDLV